MFCVRELASSSVSRVWWFLTLLVRHLTTLRNNPSRYSSNCHQVGSGCPAVSFIFNFCNTLQRFGESKTWWRNLDCLKHIFIEGFPCSPPRLPKTSQSCCALRATEVIEGFVCLVGGIHQVMWSWLAENVAKCMFSFSAWKQLISDAILGPLKEVFWSSPDVVLTSCQSGSKLAVFFIGVVALMRRWEFVALSLPPKELGLALSLFACLLPRKCNMAHVTQGQGVVCLMSFCHVSWKLHLQPSCSKHNLSKCADRLEHESMSEREGQSAQVCVCVSACLRSSWCVCFASVLVMTCAILWPCVHAACNTHDYSCCVVRLFWAAMHETPKSTAQTYYFRHAVLPSQCLGVNSPALILSKNSGVSLAKNRRRSAKIGKTAPKMGLESAKISSNRLKLAKISPKSPKIG